MRIYEISYKENYMLEELAKPISDLQAEISDIWGRL
jgi:hypothetical protein